MRYGMNEDGTLDDSISPWGKIRESSKQVIQAGPAPRWDIISNAFSGKTYKSAPSIDMDQDTLEPLPELTSESMPSMSESQPMGGGFQGEIPGMEEAFGLTQPDKPKRNFGKSFLTGLMSTAIPSLVGRESAYGFSNLMDQSDNEETDYNRAMKNYEAQRMQMLRNPLFGSAYSSAVKRLNSGQVPEGTDPNMVIQEELGKAYDRDVKARLYGRSPIGQLRQEGASIDEALNRYGEFKRNSQRSDMRETAAKLQAKYEMDPESLTPEEQATLAAYYKTKKGSSASWSPDDDFIQSIKILAR